VGGSAGTSVRDRIAWRRAEEADCRGYGRDARVRVIQDHFHGLAVHDSVRRLTAHACIDSWLRNATSHHAARLSCTAQPTFGNSTPETADCEEARITAIPETGQPLRVPDLSRIERECLLLASK